MERRTFLKTKALALGGFGIMPMTSTWGMDFLNVPKDFISRRPPLDKRTFISSEVEKLILEIKSSVRDKELAWMFENCYPNTLDTTVDYEVINGKPDTFIITGDIDAMWLRDSTAQVWPYMPLIQKDEKLKNLIVGLINRQVKCVLIDPYANAFYKDLSKVSKWNDDIPKTVPGVHERKWEIDSLCYNIRLSDGYFNLTGDASIFDDSWDRAMKLIVKTFRAEQREDGTSPYKFIRKTSKMTDAPLFEGAGRPIKYTGLICSMFRPSDDATMYPYLIPSNLFAMLSLRQLAKIYDEVLKDSEFAKECKDFANQIENAVNKYAISEHLDFGKIYAYEVDGFGNKVFMDDANVPSLMSLAYLDKKFTGEATYKNTRAFLISDFNPYYLKGKVAEGQGSPHTGKEKIWPMGVILRALTSTDKSEIKKCLKMLKSSHVGTGFMHEAFHKDDAQNYTRDWFSWANTLFGELVIKVHSQYPELL
ncbi:MAG: glycoside hydrolase family 125 protein [Bacteroidota bacterium]